MTDDDYEKLGYPNSVKRLLYWNYWKRKFHEIRNVQGKAVLFLRLRKLLRRQRKLRKRYDPSGLTPSFSQCAEDLVIHFLRKKHLNESDSFTWLDIGAHDPVELSNTRLFYLLGDRGINIEPDPELFERFSEERPEDVNLNVGIGSSNSVADFFVMNSRALNTFSREKAKNIVREDERKPVDRRAGHRIDKVIKIPIRTIDSVLSDLNGRVPDFVSIDAEGLDLTILQSWNLEKYRPAFFCVETDKGESGAEIVRLMKANRYRIVETTQANTIFIDRKFDGRKT